ncbi:S9 family peptidase [Halioglobus pacificus]|uniref:Acyl-peptide hydrolase n=1 Tax=Parahalioglobus pacificus TaxID=930806 RepID=A0A919CJZ1_9GAMM|nr:S9 family peptidase [Halioglobus pacificus]GHD32269.1 peptidase S9 [Halioglobus pacificus]
MRILLSLLFLVFGASVASADDEKTPLSAEVLWKLERAGAPVVSPDGTMVVVPLTTYDEDNESETRLWLLANDGSGAQRPITAEGSAASSPVFSPSGAQLAFISKRNEDEAGQIYLLPTAGPGEASKLTDVPTGVSGLRWEGEYLYFISSVWPEHSWEEMADRLKAEEEDHISAFTWSEMPYSFFDHYLNEDRKNHLFRIPAAGGDVEPVTEPLGMAMMPAGTGAGDYDVSPDGKHLAFVTTSTPGAVYSNGDVFLVELGKKKARNLTSDNPANDYGPMFSPDGKQLAFARQRIAGFYGDQAKLMTYSMASGDTQMHHEDWDYGVSGLVWTPDSSGFYGAIDDKATRRVYSISLDGNAPSPVTKENDYGALSIADNGVLVAQRQSALHPVRIGTVDTQSGDFNRLDAFNDEVMATVDAGTYESVTYKGHNGADIQMWVHYPPGFNPRKEYPLMMLIHGGPHGAISDNFHYRWNAQTFASWGYVTAWPNFHGSSGFGQDFVDAINPDWTTKPYADVMAAADFLAQKKFIDEDRMVAAGGSYGGYLSSIILGKENPFKALVIHAAVYDLYAQMSADFAVNMERFGPYWENPEIYREQSPHYYAKNFNTPSLVIHGQNDLRVPVGQGFELYRTLQTKGVESRLVYYPDENHWILSRANSLHWYGEVRDWVSKFAEPGGK